MPSAPLMDDALPRTGAGPGEALDMRDTSPAYAAPLADCTVPASQDTSTAASRLVPGSVWEFLAVAFPLIVSCSAVSLQLVIDRLFLTWHSTGALAAATSAGMLFWLVVSLPMGLVNYVQTFVAQYEGAGRKSRVGAALWQGIYISLVAGVVMLTAIPLVGPGLTAIGHEADLLALEIEYLDGLMWGAWPSLLAAALSCYFIGRGQNWTVVWVNVVATVVNALGDYVLIFGLETPWGALPAYGVWGAAWATNTAAVASCSVYILILCRDRNAHDYHVWTAWRFDSALVRRLAYFGLPAGIHLFLEVVCYTSFVQLVGRMGSDALAATSLAFALNSLAFMPMIGIGTAVATLVGKRIGEQRPDLGARTTWTACWISLSYTSLFVALYLLAPDAILSPYAQFGDPAEFARVHAEVVMLLRFVAMYSAFDAMAIVFSSALRGAGDTRFVLLFNVSAGVLVLVLPTAIAAAVSPHLTAAWWALSAYLGVLATGYLLRFIQGKWRHMRVIEGPGEELA